MNANPENKFIEDAKALAEKYTLNIVNKWMILKEMVHSHGVPIYLRDGGHFFIVLFKKPPLWEQSIILIQKDVRRHTVLLQGKCITYFGYDPLNGTLLISEASRTERDKNQITHYDIASKRSTIIVPYQQNPEPVMIGPLSNGKFAYHNRGSRKIVVSDADGNTLKAVDIGDKVIRNLKTRPPDHIYLLSVSKMHVQDPKIPQGQDSIFKIVPQNRLQIVYKGSFSGFNRNKIWDFEILNKTLFVSADSYFVKADLHGNEIFRVSMKNALWQQPLSDAYIASLTVDMDSDDTLYALCHSGADNMIYQLSV